MSKASRLRTAFSDKAFATLDEWLLRRPTGLTDIVTLEGFLTAIVIGPHTLSPNHWLPKVWGGKTPRFKDREELNRFIALVMDFYNEIVTCFESNPAVFEPTFYERTLEGKTIRIVDEWCEGFVKGVRLDAAGWKRLKRERPELLKPIELFGTRAGWSELKAGGESVMHAAWSARIAPAVRDIHAYWIPHRIGHYGPRDSARSH